nr:phosphoglucosamine mutase [Gammaproteobacteria bacterium]
AFKELDIPFERAAVGDRHVMELLGKQGWHLGGENSGHIICLDRVTTGDAIVAALAVLAVMKESGESLSRLRGDMELYPQVLLNVPMKQRVDLSENSTIQDAVKQAEARLGDSGRILLRPSGTEPLVRVMVEGKVANDVQEICEQVARAVGDALG